jgi:hypothetical protein
VPVAPAAVPRERRCPFCRETVHPEAVKCKHCQSNIAPRNPRDDENAFLLGFFLGPVGLFSKGCYAAGFAGLVMGFLACALISPILAPIFWIGMAAHASGARKLN